MPRIIKIIFAIKKQYGVYQQQAQETSKQPAHPFDH